MQLRSLSDKCLGKITLLAMETEVTAIDHPTLARLNAPSTSARNRVVNGEAVQR